MLINARRHVATQGAKKLKINRSSVKVVFAKPRMMGVVIHGGGLHLEVVSAHAPHTHRTPKRAQTGMVG